MLLTRPPLYSAPEGTFRVRLACVRHAASVDSEPGSNSHIELIRASLLFACFCLVVKDRIGRQSPSQGLAGKKIGYRKAVGLFNTYFRYTESTEKQHARKARKPASSVCLSSVIRHRTVVRPWHFSRPSIRRDRLPEVSDAGKFPAWGPAVKRKPRRTANRRSAQGLPGKRRT